MKLHIPQALMRFQDWLISTDMQIEVLEQVSPFTEETWAKILQNNAIFKESFEFLISDSPIENGKHLLSRGKVKSYAQKANESRLQSDRKVFFLSTMIWGYSDKHRGDNVPRMLATPHLDNTLIMAMQALSQDDIERAFSYFANEQTKIDHLNSSFFTKLLYFAGLALETRPTPLILDAKVVNNWALLTGNQLNQYAVKDYMTYIETVNRWAKQMNCSPDALEYWLFIAPPQFLRR